MVLTLAAIMVRVKLAVVMVRMVAMVVTLAVVMVRVVAMVVTLAAVTARLPPKKSDLRPGAKIRSLHPANVEAPGSADSDRHSKISGIFLI